MFPIGQAAGVLSSLIGGIFKGHWAHKQQQMANSIHPVNAVYNVSPYAQAQVGSAENQYNGRMAGASQEEQNIAANQANSFQQVERNAGSGSQALAMLAGLQGNSNNAYNQLGQQEAINKENQLAQLGQARQGMTNELTNVYNDKLRNYNNDLTAKNSLLNAAQANRGSAVSGFQNALIAGGNMADQMNIGGGSKPFGMPVTSPLPIQGMNYNQSLNGGSYINPMMLNPQMNYNNPFIR